MIKLTEQAEIKVIPVWIKKPIIKYKERFSLVTQDGKYELISSKVTVSKKKGQKYGFDSEWTQRSMNIPKNITDLSNTFVFFEELEDGTWIANFFQPLEEFEKIKPI